MERRRCFFGNEIACGVRQRGNLLHRLNEIVFAPGSSVDWKTASRSQLNRWLEGEWTKLLPAEGANLLMPGNKAVADGLLEEAKRAIWRLIEHLRAAGVTRTMVNVAPPRIPFAGGNICGLIDLQVEKTGGCTAVIDLKYGGHPQRRQELIDNLHLQLAVYARLIKGSAWPDAAFLSWESGLYSRKMTGFSQMRKSFLRRHYPLGSSYAGTNLKCSGNGVAHCSLEAGSNAPSLGLILLTVAVSGRNQACQPTLAAGECRRSVPRFRCSDRLGGKRMKVRSIAAGAGTGKTTELTRVIRESILSGECRPHGIIGTTFTKKAAGELVERVRQEFFKIGKIDLAERLAESLLGTVDSVCVRLLTGFAFEAGVSPDIQIIAETDAAALQSSAIEDSCSLAEMQTIRLIGERLCQKEGYELNWKTLISVILRKRAKTRSLRTNCGRWPR